MRDVAFRCVRVSRVRERRSCGALTAVTRAQVVFAVLGGWGVVIFGARSALS